MGAVLTNPLRVGLRQERVIPPQCLVIFGASGDLTHRKLVPALFELFRQRRLPSEFAVLGCARRPWSDEEFRGKMAEAMAPEVAEHRVAWEQFAAGLFYEPVDLEDPASVVRLGQRLEGIDRLRATRGNRTFYLSVSPNFYGSGCRSLAAAGLLSDPARSRVVIEKPFGRYYGSAQELNRVVRTCAQENQIFRIDHYLGKETVQNILALCFANELYEPIWNSHYVDSVQITMAEDIGLGGRAGYYDGIGAARDVIQNHLLQLLALTAMEEPVSFHPDEVKAEKIKVLAATRLALPLDLTTSRGQYAAGWQGGQQVVGLLDEDGFSTTSTTETFAAITLDVDTRRWAGVPFYLRSGKRLGRRVTEIALMFKRAPHLPFDATMTEELGQNALVIRVQPDEGITLRFGSKVPGTLMEVRDVNMDFSYGSAFAEDSPEAYERLILDVLLGEPSLFPVNAEVELSWEILDPALEYWAAHGKPDSYESGTWGPESAFEMLRRSGHEWRRP